MYSMRNVIIGFGILILVGCSESKHEQFDETSLSGSIKIHSSTPTPSISVQHAPIPTPSVSVQHAPVPTPSVSVQHAPTPTALAIEVVNQYLPYRVKDTPVGTNTSCGIVDTFDFPLDPPNGGHISGGLDFGIYRERQDGYHTGEDFSYRDRSNFGSPVYSIGNGIVTYADSDGWRRDRGTMVIKHSLPDGGIVYSFYGHLDPPSVLLAEGTCVERGDSIGRIGQPRTPPHLHFEIRTHWPDKPGPGYWPVDPRRGGWISPTEFVENFRFDNAPHIVWTRSMRASYNQVLGELDDEIVLLVENQNLIGAHPQDGEVQFNRRLPFQATDLWYDTDSETIYLGSFAGRLSAIRITKADLLASSEALDVLWEIDLDQFGMAEIMPLPQGGVVFSTRGLYVGVSEDGQVVWQIEVGAEPMSWVIFEDRLIITTKGSTEKIWSVDISGMMPWEESIGGILKGSEGRLYLHNQTGVYRLAPFSASAELIYPLPFGSPEDGDLIALPDGHILVMHSDRFDQRIVFLSEHEGSLWDRSYDHLHFQSPRLFTNNGTLYVMAEREDPAYGEIEIYKINTQSDKMNEVFRAGVHAPIVSGSELMIREDSFLIYLYGRRILSVDIPD